MNPTGVRTIRGDIPTNFALSQNYPNPFNPETNIHYSLKNSGRVRLSVQNILGQEVAILVQGIQSSGAHEVKFSGEKLGSGVYFYKLETNEGSITKKMMLMK
jgi:hypothetical protein